MKEEYMAETKNFHIRHEKNRYIHPYKRIILEIKL
jgi:hypothetical protein